MNTVLLVFTEWTFELQLPWYDYWWGNVGLDIFDLFSSHSSTIRKTFKPIFHCDAKYMASGVGVGQCPQRQNFALEIPTCWYILALPNAKICVTSDAKPKICVSPDANPRRESVEYRWRWAFWRWGWHWACTFHIFCVDFICI